MKILSAEQIREWDQYTITNEPVASIDLMERAAARCSEWLMKNYPTAEGFAVFCGKGNNGGDGLAIARMLLQNNYIVTVYILAPAAADMQKGTEDFQTNLARLHLSELADVHYIQTEENIHPVPDEWVVVDALLGSGINRPLDGLTATLVAHLNSSGQLIISIDIPSGLFADQSAKGMLTIQATHTLSFQCYKLAFLFAENETAVGEVHIMDIGLHPDYPGLADTKMEMIQASLIESVYKPRKKFAHKGHFGHALVIAGSYGKMGAAVLAAQSCLRSGVGLLTAYIPGCGYSIMQSSVPEAMVITDKDEKMITGVQTDTSIYDAIAIGPGIGTHGSTIDAIQKLITTCRHPVVLDADALNGIALNKDMLAQIPEGSVLTPHPKEFERLFGACANDFARAELASGKAKALNVVIVLKGHYTLIATPGGQQFFNTTGNAGMATGGSGDVLTGIITGLLAQGYDSVQAALLGVYLHGLAGDLAAATISQEAMAAGDIISHIGHAFRRLSGL